MKAAAPNDQPAKNMDDTYKPVLWHGLLLLLTQ